jgi:broad specificity polyphosphatase/5'/3'-nucleotidase SurE
MKETAELSDSIKAILLAAPRDRSIESGTCAGAMEARPEGRPSFREAMAGAKKRAKVAGFGALAFEMTRVKTGLARAA